MITSTHNLANILDPRFSGKSLTDTKKPSPSQIWNSVLKNMDFGKMKHVIQIYFLPTSNIYKKMANPVMWWKMFNNFSEVSDFAPIAIKILSVPSSNASVEHEFSYQSRIHTKVRRNKLSKETIEKLLSVEHVRFLELENESNNSTHPISSQTHEGKY